MKEAFDMKNILCGNQNFLISYFFGYLLYVIFDWRVKLINFEPHPDWSSALPQFRGV